VPSSQRQICGRKKEEGRRKKEEGRGKKEEGRRKREEGRRKKEDFSHSPTGASQFCKKHFLL